MRIDIFRANMERSMLFWLAFLMLLACFFACWFALPRMVNSLNSYTCITGKSEYAETRIFTEERHTKSGTRFDKAERLVLKIENYPTEFTIGGDYEKFWKQISYYANNHSDFVIYNEPSHLFINPMQIEANHKVLLPLSHHKKLNTWVLVICIAVCALLLYLFKKVLKSYRRKFLKEDRETWNRGFFGKIRVMFRFIFR